MASKGMYFGTRDYMQWIVCPSINYEASKSGWSVNAKYLDGGNFNRRSVAAAKAYNFSWNLKSRDELRPVTDYADGLFGLGQIYFLDPFAMDKNLAPQFWAAPSVNAQDGPVVLRSTTSNVVTRPTLTDTASNTLGYPVKTATYAVTAAAMKPTLYIPIPPDHTLWIGVHGTSSGSSAVQVIPALSPTANAAAVTPAMLAVTSTTRVNTSFSGNTYKGVTITLGGTTGAVNVAGLIVQVLPIGAVPATGGFISGQGNSGCSFEDQPSLSQYSAALDKVGLSVSLVETGAWV